MVSNGLWIHDVALVRTSPISFGEKVKAVDLTSTILSRTVRNCRVLGWVLTAAHCLENKEAKNVRLFYGAASLKDVNGVTQSAEKFFIHSDYKMVSNGLWIHDVALVRTSPISFGEKVKAVDLTSTILSRTVRNCRVLGWGLTEKPGEESFSERLQYLDNIRAVPGDTCRDSVANLPSIYLNIGREHICAIPNARGLGIRNGDSGGPLINSATGQIIGVASSITLRSSSADRPDHDGYPDAFTDAFSHKEWIDSQLADEIGREAIALNGVGI